MNLNYLNLLPDEMLLKLLSETDDLKTLSKWCQTSKRVNQICKDEGFWSNKYRKDFGIELTLVEGETWREQYKQITQGRINSPISAGNNHYGIIDQNGNLYMAGNNERGQLGVGKDIEKSKIPILVKFPQKSQKVISISTGIDISGAVTEDGKVYIWGRNDRKLFPTNQRNIWLPKELTFPEKATKIMVEYTGYIISLENSSVYFYSDDPHLKLIKGFQQLDVLDIHINEVGVFSVVTKDHKLYMWGDLSGYSINEHYNTEIPVHIPLPEPVIKITNRLYHPVVISITGNIYSLGFDLSHTWYGIHKPKPILIKLPEKIVQIEGYYDTFAALSETGRLYMWGDNAQGRISSDREEDFLIPSEISFGVLVNFVSIGGLFTIAVSSDGAVNYWGDPERGPE